jgi:hypothetical protein
MEGSSQPHSELDGNMPGGIVAVGTLFPVVSGLGKPKKRLVQQLGNQWLTLEKVINGRQYQVLGVFLREEDALLFKRALKKRERKEQRLKRSSYDGPGAGTD